MELDLSAMWLLARRILLFEHPVKKFKHLHKQLSRLSKASSVVKVSAFDAVPSAIFDSFAKPTKIDMYFSEFVACRFADAVSDGALARWSELAQLRTTNQPNNLVRDRNFHEEQWRHFIIGSCIPWGRLANCFADDEPVAKFVAASCNEIAAHFARNGANNLSSQSSAEFHSDICPTSAARGIYALIEKQLRKFREQLPADIFPDGVFIGEGATELILMPYFAKLLDKSFNKMGVVTIAAGGANQVVRRFADNSQTFRIPIFCMLDADASEQSRQLSEMK